MVEEITIVEDESYTPTSPVAIEGFPDMGLVGAIACAHLADQLDLRKVAHFESRLFPPIMVVHREVLTEPVRILGGKDLMVVTSEIAIPPIAVYPLADLLSRWFEKKNVRIVISLSGFPEQERMEVEKPLVYGVVNGSQASSLLRENEIDVMEEGFVTGVYALLLKDSLKRGIPAIALLAQSYLNYPDPGAAASVITTLNKILGLNVDVKPLIEKGDEIRVKARDLMRQAQGSMEGMKKMTEQEIPLMYR